MEGQTQVESERLFAPNLSSYTDHRLYLKDYYEFKRATLSTPIRAYSYATFSAAADIKSPNYLKLIIDGQRNLSEVMIKKFAKALQLNKSESQEFAALVHYSQAKDPLDRNRCLKVLADIRVKRQMKEGGINPEVMEKVPSWVTWVLYAMTDQKGVDFSLIRLREIMRGRASQEEIKKAFEKLIKSGELEFNKNGMVTKGRKLMQGSGDIPAALVRKLQAELIYLGMESLFQDDPTEREFGAFTMALTKEEFEQVKFEVRQLRKRLYAEFLVEREKSKGDRVYQLNFQLFPVTDSV